MSSPELISPRFEQALRLAAVGHDGQKRRTSGVPYMSHVVSVARMLDRAGFDEDVVIAGLLHDLVEDTAFTLEDVRRGFGDHVAGLVAHCSEVKTDHEGRKRPWIDRKRDHLKALEAAPLEARAIVLADKLHNLISIEIDLDAGRDVWTNFHAGRDQVLWYYEASISVCGTGDPRLEDLAAACQERLAAIKARGR